MADEKHGQPRARHEEARLAREMGTAPVVELHGMVKVRAGRVVGVFVGPHDAAELLAVEKFEPGTGSEDGSLRFGMMHGLPFFLLEDDL